MLSRLRHQQRAHRRGKCQGALGRCAERYQRRADLIPNLVATVKGAAARGEGILTEVTKARAKATAIQVSGDDLTDPAKVQQFQQRAGQRDAARCSRCWTEAYPELKSQGNFHDADEPARRHREPHHHRASATITRRCRPITRDPHLPRRDRRQDLLRRQADDAVPGDHAGRRDRADGRFRECELRGDHGRCSPDRQPHRWLVLLALRRGAVRRGGGAGADLPEAHRPRRRCRATCCRPTSRRAADRKLSKRCSKTSTRQLVVATIPDLQGYPIEDYGYRLGRALGDRAEGRQQRHHPDRRAERAARCGSRSAMGSSRS